MAQLRIAMFRTPWDTTTVLDERLASVMTEYVRLSEFVEVEFPPLAPNSRDEQLERIQAAKEAVRIHYESQLTQLIKNAQELLTEERA